jgi:hypothetical protein
VMFVVGAALKKLTLVAIGSEHDERRGRRATPNLHWCRTSGLDRR